ncbi:MAG: HEAT repeat domain-containing protein [Acidimicrobiia bacterium]
MSSWAHILGVRDEEKRLVLQVAGAFAVIQSTHALGANAADALFFLGFGVENLPLMIVISGLAVMITLLLHGIGLGRFGARKWLPGVTAVSGLLAIGEWVLLFTDALLIYPIVWVSTQVVIMLTFTVMWNAAATSTTTRQAKRLYPIWASAGVAGAVFGNLATGPLAEILGTQTLLAIQGVALVAGALLLASVAKFFQEEGGEARNSAGRELVGVVRTINVSRLMRLTAVSVFVLWALFYLVVFPFNEAVAASFETDAEIARFLGLFASVATALTFLVSLLVTNRLFARLGIVISLMIVPVVYMVGFGVWLSSYTLATAGLVRGIQWIAVNAVGGTATTALFGVLSGRRRGQVMSFMVAVPAQLGMMAGGVILILTASASDQTLFSIGLALSAAGLVAIVMMRSAYTNAIVEAVRKGLVGVFRVPHEGVVTPLGKESAQVLTRYLDGNTPEERLMGIVGLSAAGDSSHNEFIEPLLNDESAFVRIAAFDSICGLEPSRMPTLLTTALDDRSPAVRRHAIDMVKSQPNGDLRTLVRASLSDPDPGVRAAAAAVVDGVEGQRVFDELIASSDSGAVIAVLEEAETSPDLAVDTGTLLKSADPAIRVAATRLIGFGGSIPLHELREGLDDPSLQVRRVTADILAQSDEGRDLLFQVVETGSVSATDVALRSLTPVDRFTDGFLAWAQREAARARRLTELRRAILSGPSSTDTDYLAVVLQKRSMRLSDWVILAMTTSDTAPAMSVIERGVVIGDVETRAQAIEALDVIGARSVAKPLIDLLEAQSGELQLTQHEALIELTSDFDPWLSALASRSLEEPASSGFPSFLPDSSAMRGRSSEDQSNTLDRVIALQRVPTFSSLDPEDLELIAQAADEAHFVAGEPIYTTGDAGGEMMVIIDGEVVVTATHDDAVVEIARYGAGQHVGELALLDGSPRSADVHAGDEGVSALIIAALDLTSILEERPAVAIAMLSTLAARLRRQT